MNENTNISSLPCEVVQDLLPLYQDGLVSEKTSKMVDAHLAGCSDCRKEHDLIKAELPGENTHPSTGQRFADMMKRLRIRRIITIALAVITTCAVLVGGFYGLTQVPFRHISEDNIDVVRIYPYEDGTDSRLFLLNMVPAWNSPTFHKMWIHETAEPGVWALECEFKVPIISGKHAELDSWEDTWDLDINADIENIQTIIFNGEAVWTAEDASPVPDYVMAYRDFEQFQKLYNGMTLDVEKNLIGFDNAFEDRFIYWDLDGNLLYEGDGTDADKVIDFDVPLDLADYPPVIDE